MGYCDVCGAGTYSLAGATGCTACPDGYYQPNAGSDSCIQCKTCSGGSSPAPGGCYGSIDTLCIGCAAGEYSIGGVCMACPAGTSSLSGATSCTPCQSGTYAALEGMGYCNICGAGSYSLEGASSCTSCASGSLQPSEGASSCLTCKTCDPGYARAGGCFALDGVFYDTVCNACAPGQYSDAGVSCVSCPPGTYSLAGAGSCVQCGKCLAGYFRSGCGGGGAGQCLVCTNTS